MANIFQEIAPKILSQALLGLRENAIMPRLVNSNYSADAKEKGQSITIPVPTKMATQDVIPGAYSQAAPNLQIDTVNLPLNYWKESAFSLSDAESMTIMDGVLSMQVKEASRAIANDIDRSLFGLYQGAYNFVGTPGTTPFVPATQAAEAISCRKLLNNNLALLSDRRMVLGADAEANAIALTAFQFYLNSGTTETMTEGQLGRKFGFDWYMDQNAPTFISGTLSGVIVTSGVPTSVVTADPSNPALRNPRVLNTVVISGATNGTTIKIGDVFTVAGDLQTYVATNASVITGGIANITFSPAPKVFWAAGSTLTLKGNRAINLAFHRDALALAVRPLSEASISAELGAKSMTMVDPITGIPLRLQVRLEFNQVRYALDCLWGVALVRPEHLVVLAG